MGGGTGEVPRRASDGSALSDALLDQLDATLRRIRRAVVKPAHTAVPVPSLGRPLELAKLFVCDALADLDQAGRSVTVKDVAAAMHLEHSTVSRVLGELEGDDLVRRGVDPADRRRTVVALSERGRAVVEDTHALRRSLTRTLLADWGPQDVASLAALLSRLADSVVERGEELVAQICAAAQPAEPAQAAVAANATTEAPGRAGRKAAGSSHG